MAKIISSPVAASIPVNDTPLLAIAPVKNIQEGIEKLEILARSTSRGFTFCQYNGNANAGRFLEFFSGIDSDTAPLYSQDSLSIVSIVAATTAPNATCTIGFYNNTTLLYTITFTAQQRVIASGTPLFTLAAMGSLKVKINSGSITKPHLSLVVRGGT